MEDKINVKNVESVDMDFEKSAVPKEARKSFWSITIVWLGFVFVITSMMTGGGLASGLSFKEILTAISVGNIFLCFIAVAIANMASKTGLSFALITRHTFGNKGSKIATLFVPIVILVGIQFKLLLMENLFRRVLGIEGYGELAILFLSAIVMGIFSFAGIKAITIWVCRYSCNNFPFSWNSY